MTSMIRVIGCVSSETRHSLIFRSLIRVLSQGNTSSLKHRWSFSESGPFDVWILDIDDEENIDHLHSDRHGVIVLLAGNRPLPDSHPFTLTKPIRGNEFLQLLQSIEAAGWDNIEQNGKSAAPAVERAAPVTNSPIKPESGLAAKDEATFSLTSWPDLPQMPSEIVHDAARICAFLSIRPGTLTTISHFLDIPADTVNHILQRITTCSHGFDTCILTEYNCHPVSDAQNVIPIHDHGQTVKPSSFLSKIWNRLKGAA
ncbi:MAG: hypothetical protein Q7S87_16695 [Agitococcus sp.]|nr:hypothetical protein [Agitococcus sp.]